MTGITKNEKLLFGGALLKMANRFKPRMVSNVIHSIIDLSGEEVRLRGPRRPIRQIDRDERNKNDREWIRYVDFLSSKYFGPRKGLL